MRNNDANIEYRPDISKQLEEIKNNVFKLYNQNALAITLINYAEIIEKEDNLKGQRLRKLAKMAETDYLCVSNITPYSFKRAYGLEYPTLLNSIRSLFKSIGQYIDKSLGEIDMITFSRMEKSFINDFFYVLKMPSRNPNLKPNVRGYCHYDNNSKPEESFFKDFKHEIEFMNDKTILAISLFKTEN